MRGQGNMKVSEWINTNKGKDFALYKEKQFERLGTSYIPVTDDYFKYYNYEIVSIEEIPYRKIDYRTLKIIKKGTSYHLKIKKAGE